MPAYALPDGYVYELEQGANWTSAPDDGWETVVRSPDGTEEHVGFRRIDDARCAVFLCSDGRYRAAMAHCCC